MSDYSNLIKTLERGDQQLIDMVASKIFFDNQGKPREDQITAFVNQTGIKNFTTFINGGYIGTIIYKEKVYYYTAYVGKDE